MYTLYPKVDDLSPKAVIAYAANGDIAFSEWQNKTSATITVNGLDVNKEKSYKAKKRAYKRAKKRMQQV